ncbi:MAG: hypothetical protein ACRD0I_05530 [Acidimicrobiales bacterium]
MERQLVLIDESPGHWTIDEPMRQIGREGLAAARRALSQAQRAQAAA